MSDESGRRQGQEPFSSAQRQRVIDALCEHYAQDRLGLAEFERRLDRANRASVGSELAELLADLPSLSGPAPVQAGEAGSNPDTSRRARSGEGGSGRALSVPPGSGQVAAHRIPDSQFEFAVWSGRSRSGSWVPARTIRAVAFMGGVELDLREALFGPGEIRIHCAAFMGGIEVIVPPGVHVDAGGFAVMGGFEEELSGAGEISDTAPTVRVTGFAVLGAVEIHCRLPGESARQARRRRKADDQKRLKRARDER